MVGEIVVLMTVDGDGDEYCCVWCLGWWRGDAGDDRVVTGGGKI